MKAVHLMDKNKRLILKRNVFNIDSLFVGDYRFHEIRKPKIMNSVNTSW